MLVEPVSDVELDELIDWIDAGYPVEDHSGWDTKDMLKRLAFALRRSRIGQGVY